MTTNTSPTQVSGSRKTDTETAKTAAQSLREDAENKARELGEAVADKARSQVESAKDGVAEEISSVSRALRHASDELRDGSPQERTFGYMAGTLADLADTVRGKDLGEVVGDLSDFARRNPVAFLGGAALLGFAGVRMAKASQRTRAADDRHGASDAGAGGFNAASHTTGSSATTSGAGSNHHPTPSVRTGGSS